MWLYGIQRLTGCDFGSISNVLNDTFYHGTAYILSGYNLAYAV
jgi:hypothetical protein